MNEWMDRWNKYFKSFGRCQTVCYDGSFLHTLSTEAVDSYTSRVTASVMSRQRFTSGFVDMAVKKKGAWLHQVDIYL